MLITEHMHYLAYGNIQQKDSNIFLFVSDECIMLPSHVIVPPINTSINPKWVLLRLWLYSWDLKAKSFANRKHSKTELFEDWFSNSVTIRKEDNLSGFWMVGTEMMYHRRLWCCFWQPSCIYHSKSGLLSTIQNLVTSGIQIPSVVEKYFKVGILITVFYINISQY